MVWGVHGRGIGEFCVYYMLRMFFFFFSNVIVVSGNEEMCDLKKMERQISMEMHPTCTANHLLKLQVCKDETWKVNSWLVVQCWWLIGLTYPLFFKDIACKSAGKSSRIKITNIKHPGRSSLSDFGTCKRLGTEPMLRLARWIRDPCSGLSKTVAFRIGVDCEDGEMRTP